MPDAGWGMADVPPSLHQRSADFYFSLQPNGTPGSFNENQYYFLWNIGCWAFCNAHMKATLTILRLILINFIYILEG